MKRVPHRDGFESAGGGARQLHGHADGGGAARREQHLLQISRREFGEFFRQLDRRNIRITPGAKRERVHLRHDGLNHARMAKADLVDVVAVEIQQAPAVQVFDVRAVARLQNIQAGRGQRLMEEVFGVLVQPAACFCVDVLGGPGLAMGR